MSGTGYYYSLGVNVRKGPSTNYSIVGYLNKGTKIWISSTSNNYGRYETNKWVSFLYLSKTDPTASNKNKQTDDNYETSYYSTGYYYVSDGCNVRNSPGTTNTNIIGRLNFGQQVYIYKTVKYKGTDWGKHSAGWTSFMYLTKNNPNPEPKPKVPDPVPVTPKPEDNDKYETSSYSTGYYYASDGCNVRSKPGTSSTYIARLEFGTRVYIYETVRYKNSDWGRHSSGWTSFMYLTRNDPNPPKPSTETPATQTPVYITKEIRYTTEAVNVRSGRGTGYYVVTRIENTNEAINVWNYSNGWYETIFNNKSGYVSSSVLSKNKLVFKRLYIQKSVNVHSEANVNSAIIGKYDDPGTMVYVYDTYGSWSEIRWNGNKAYVSSSYLNTTPPEIKKEPVVPNYSTMYVSSGTNARTDPSMSGTIVAYFYKNEKVKFVSKEGNWAKIWFENKYVYMYYDRLSKTEIPDDKYTEKYTKTSCNVRSGPGTNYPIVGYYTNAGTIVKVVSESMDWAKIIYEGKTSAVAEPERNRAYVSATLLSLVNPNEDNNNKNIPKLESNIMYVAPQGFKVYLYKSLDDLIGTGIITVPYANKVQVSYISNVMRNNQYWAYLSTVINNKTYTGYIAYNYLTKYCPTNGEQKDWSVKLSVLNNLYNKVNGRWSGIKGEVNISAPTNRTGSCTVDLYAVQKGSGGIQTTLACSNIRLKYGENTSRVINFSSTLGKRLTRDNPINYYASSTDDSTQKILYTCSDKENFDTMQGSHIYMSPPAPPKQIYRDAITSDNTYYIVNITWIKEVNSSYYDETYLKIFCKTNTSYDTHSIPTTNKGTFTYYSSYTTSNNTTTSYTFKIPRSIVNDDVNKIEVYAALNYKYELDILTLGNIQIREIIYPPTPPALNIYAINNLTNSANDGLIYGEKGKIEINYFNESYNTGYLTVYAYQNKNLSSDYGTYMCTVFDNLEIKTGSTVKEINFTNLNLNRENYIKYYGIVKYGNNQYTSFPKIAHSTGTIWQECSGYHYYNNVPSYVSPYFIQEYTEENKIKIAWNKSYDDNDNNIIYYIYVYNNEINYNSKNFYVKSNYNVINKKYNKVYTTNNQTSYIIPINNNYDDTQIWIETRDKYNNSYYLTGDTLTIKSKTITTIISIEDYYQEDFLGNKKISGDYGKLKITYIHPKDINGTVNLHAILKNQNGQYKVFKNIYSYSAINKEEVEIILDFIKIFGPENVSSYIRYYATATSVDNYSSVSKDWEPKANMYEEWVGTHYFNKQPYGSILSINEKDSDLKAQELNINWTNAIDDISVTIPEPPKEEKTILTNGINPISTFTVDYNTQYYENFDTESKWKNNILKNKSFIGKRITE